MGDMQGKSAQALAGLKLAASADKTVESGAFFAARAVTWWNQTILQRTASHPLKDYPYHILVTSHGGFITTLVKTLTQSRKAKCAPGVVVWHCVNSSITIIEVDERQQGIVVRYGDASHLNEELESAVESNADEVQVEKLLE
jgi:broad specificity phosphatase PhoE